jgi:hypothetical protein
LYGNQAAKTHRQQQSYEISETTADDFSRPTSEKLSNNEQLNVMVGRIAQA